MVEINRTTTALIVIALLISYPFVAATFLGFLFSRNSTNFSIYNTGWNGTSEFMEKFRNHPNEGQISTIVGSSNILNRLNASEMNDSQGALIILGPAVHYDFSESLAVLMYAINGGRVLIADDFGTANDILSVLSIFLGFMSQINLGGANMLGMDPETSGVNTSGASFPFPIAGIAINGSLLADQGSYDGTPLTPVFHFPESSTQTGTTYLMPAPWVTDFTTGLSGNGVIGNFASIISMKVRYPNTSFSTDPNNTQYLTKWVPMGEFPADASAAFDSLDVPVGVELPTFNFSLQIAVLYSSSESWLESDLAAAKNDVNSIEPNLNEWGNPNIGFPVFVYFPFPMLNGSLTICSDPSIFINRYLDTTTYPDAATFDNSKFADNVIDTIMEGRTGQTIIFDEGHLANNPIHPIFPLSLYLKFLDMITMFPLFAGALPVVAILLSRRFMPKKTQAKPLLLTRVERYYGRSFFAVKMRWFLEYRQYSRGLELIYRRLRRNLSRRYPDAELTPEVIASYLESEFPDRFNFKSTQANLTVIENIIISRSPITEDEFLSHYLFIKSIGAEIS